ncbi:MAG: thioredoxin fold domain-containing protein [Gammaproteobacteria bacterium]|nr:thioredoxin fold domain-containing protein [Gammaproteobacteria bacterium]
MPNAIQAKIDILLTYIMIVSGALFAHAVSAEQTTAGFPDEPLVEPLALPEWFKLSFLDLREDLRDATAKKRGLILYFGRHDCPYCKAQLETNWGQPDIVAYTRAHFDVVAIDVLGNRVVTDLNGKDMSEKEFAVAHQAHFTPTLFFYDNRGQLALKLTGYRPPYQFRAALEYAADHHQKEGSFRDYLARAEPAESYGLDTLNEYAEFHPPTFLKDYAQHKHGKPLLIAFERAHCHACDVLHAGPLNEPQIKHLLDDIDAVQLNMWSGVPVVTPTGKHTTSKAWADELGLSYAPTLIFYDEQGKEIIRIDSVLGFYRLYGVLRYVISGGYRTYPNYQLWRSRNGSKEPAS